MAVGAATNVALYDDAADICDAAAAYAYHVAQNQPCLSATYAVPSPVENRRCATGRLARG